MKKLLVLLLCALSVNSIALADDNDKPITVDKLPQAAQQFIKKNFAKEKVSYAMVEKSLFGNEYKVVFANANKIEFDKNGAWTDLEFKVGGIPAAIVPTAIQTYVKTNHPNVKISKMEKSSLGYEVTLANGMELKFDPKFNFVRYDD